MSELPIIDKEKCQVCGLCVDVCTCGALAIVDNEVKALKTDDCGWCTLCELVCPYDAISCPYEIVTEDHAE